MEVGESLHLARRRNGLTQREVAETIGVVPLTIGRWERGSSEPTVSQLIQLSKVYKTSTDKLCGLE